MEYPPEGDAVPDEVSSSRSVRSVESLGSETASELREAVRDDIGAVLDELRQHVAADPDITSTPRQQQRVHELMGDAFAASGDYTPALREYAQAGESAAVKLTALGRRALENDSLELAESAYTAAGGVLSVEQYRAYFARTGQFSPSALKAFKVAGDYNNIIRIADQLHDQGRPGVALDLIWDVRDHIPDERVTEIADRFLRTPVADGLERARYLYSRIGKELSRSELVIFADAVVADGPWSIPTEIVAIYESAGAKDRLERAALKLLERRGIVAACDDATDLFLKAGAIGQVEELARTLVAAGHLVEGLKCFDLIGVSPASVFLMRAASSSHRTDAIMIASLVALEREQVAAIDPGQEQRLTELKTRLLEAADRLLVALETANDGNVNYLPSYAEYLERAFNVIGDRPRLDRLAKVYELSHSPHFAKRIYLSLGMNEAALHAEQSIRRALSDVSSWSSAAWAIQMFAALGRSSHPIRADFEL